MWNIKKKKNILVLGSEGMLGHDVYEFFKNESMRADTAVGTVIGLDLKDGYDFSKPNELNELFEKSIHFDYCVNCIAYTNTAAAETPDGYDMSYMLNALVPKYAASACVKSGTKLIHISTDYVFSERVFRNGQNAVMFSTYDTPFPVSVYGQHKLIGELLVRNEFGVATEMFSILRTSWLYGEYRQKSFIHKFLKNVVKSLRGGMPEVEVTQNEASVPTSTSTVVKYVADVVYGRNCSCTAHAVCVASAYAVTRCEYAREILSCLKNLDFLDEYPEMKSLLDKVEDVQTYVKPVDRNGLWPHMSAMAVNQECVPDGIQHWEKELSDFIQANGRKIIEWCLDT